MRASEPTNRRQRSGLRDSSASWRMSSQRVVANRSPSARSSEGKGLRPADLPRQSVEEQALGMSLARAGDAGSAQAVGRISRARSRGTQSAPHLSRDGSRSAAFAASSAAKSLSAPRLRQRGRRVRHDPSSATAGRAVSASPAIGASARQARKAQPGRVDDSSKLTAPRRASTDFQWRQRPKSTTECRPGSGDLIVRHSIVRHQRLIGQSRAEGTRARRGVAGQVYAPSLNAARSASLAAKGKVYNGGVNDIRSAFLTISRARGTRSFVVAARAAQRPDADVHQCRHGAVQGRFHRPGEARPIRAPSPRRSASAPAASTTTSTTSAIPRATTPFSRCSATSPSATTSRSARSSWPGSSLTKDFGLPQRRSLVTVYIDDDEAFDLWKKIAGASGPKIVRIAGSDNFWAMGDTGPCGPCSEIFYDHGDAIAGGACPAARSRRRPLRRDLEPRVHAVRAAGRRQAGAAAPPVDRHRHGARAHRRGPAGHARQLRHRPVPHADRRDREASARRRATVHRRSPRVIADHLRAHDLPDRRRRAAVERGPRLCAPPHHAPRHAPRASARRRGAVDVEARARRSSREMGQAYPDSSAPRRSSRRRSSWRRDASARTLARGLAILDEASGRPEKGAMFDGETAFTLYDTYGFPLDLTQDALRARGISVDLASFNDAMQRQREEARASWAGSGRCGDRDRVVCAAREGRRDGIPRLRDRERRGHRRRAGQGRRGRHRLDEGDERRGRDEPDAVLRRERRAGRRHRRRSPRGRAHCA